MSGRAALYARVSTTNQEEEATIDSQVAAIERYIEKQGYDLPKDYYFLAACRREPIIWSLQENW